MAHQFYPANALNNVDAVYTDLPTPEDRLRVAQMLARNDDPGHTLYTRNTIAVHWAADLHEHYQLATDLHRLKQAADAARFQLALVFRKGTPEAALIDPITVEQPVEMTVGRIKTVTNTAAKIPYEVAAIHHDFAGNDGRSPGSSAQLRMGVKPPYVAVGVGLELAQAQTVEAKFVKATISKPQARPVTAYTYVATLPIDGDPERYNTGKAVQSRPFIFGNEAVAGFFHELKLRLNTGQELLDEILAAQG